MKTMKKLLSIVMVLTLVLSLGVSALAVDITVHDENGSNSDYAAYQLFTAEVKGSDATGTLYEYKVNPDFKAAIEAALKNEKMPASVTYKKGGVESAQQQTYNKPANADDAQALLEYLGGLSSDNTDNAGQGQIRIFADAVYKYIHDNSIRVTATVTMAEGAKDATFTGLDAGYYMIAETVNAGTDNAVTTLVILDTAGNQTLRVETKEDVPSSQKKVKDTNDQSGVTTDWQDSADWDIGDQVPYQLKATLQDKHFGDYETYYLEFQDRMCEGLTMDEESVKVYLNGTEISNPFTHSVESISESGYTTLHKWVCSDIKNSISGVKAGDVITLEYTATLNEHAKIGAAGNPNDSRIVFSNNPYTTGEGESHGTTPWDKCIVFTYELDANKLDGTNEPLEGAEFTLYKKVADTFTKDGAEFVGLNEKYEEVDVAPGNKYQKFLLTAQKGKDGKMNFFSQKGLDDGDYVIVETKVPAGYNKADVLTFTITAEHTQDDVEEPQIPLNLGSLTSGREEVKVDGSVGTLTTDIINRTGLELPSTGGIGTTIFYVVGAILVAGAVILLVTKKRVNGASK